MSRSDTTHGQHPHILVVEDDSPTGEMLVMLLEMEEYQVTWSRSADDAIEHLSDRDEPGTHRLPDIVLLDLQLPSMNGPELMQHVRQRNRTPPPVIVISAWREAAATAAAEQIDALHVLIKPFAVDELLDRIADVEKWLTEQQNVCQKVEP